MKGEMLAFNTRERSSGLACTMRSRAIWASARQLFVIYGETGGYKSPFVVTLITVDVGKRHSRREC